MTLEKIGEQDLRWGLNGMMLLGRLNSIVGTWQNRLALMTGFVLSENLEFLLRIARCVGPTILTGIPTIPTSAGSQLRLWQPAGLSTSNWWPGRVKQSG